MESTAVHTCNISKSLYSLTDRSPIATPCGSIILMKALDNIIIDTSDVRLSP